jgi:hypothetical protein
MGSKVELLETGYLSKVERQSVADSVHGFIELEVPLPFSVSGLDFSVKIPLADGEEAPPEALCVAPDSPSLTGGYTVESADQDKGPATGDAGGHALEQPQDDAAEEETDRVLQERACRVLTPAMTGGWARMPAFRVGAQVGCIVETDLGALAFLRRGNLRAWELFVLATEYAPLFRKNPDLQRFDVLVITDPEHRCGLWIRLG